MIELVLKTLPPSTNHLYSRGVGGKVFLKADAKAAKEALAWEARVAYRGEPLTGPLKVRVAIFWPDMRKHDVDNIKALLDALNGIVWQDDGQVSDLHTTKHYDPKNPRVVMVISKM